MSPVSAQQENVRWYFAFPAPVCCVVQQHQTAYAGFPGRGWQEGPDVKKTTNLRPSRESCLHWPWENAKGRIGLSPCSSFLYVYHWIHRLFPRTQTPNRLLLNEEKGGVTPFTQSSLDKFVSRDSGINAKFTWDSLSPISQKLWGIYLWDTVKSLKNSVRGNYSEATFSIPPLFFFNVLVNSAVLCNTGGYCREPVEELPVTVLASSPACEISLGGVKDPHSTQIS